MELTNQQLGRMMDLSAVRAEVDFAEIEQLAATAKRLNCIVAFALPCYTRELQALLAGAPDVGIGGVVSFPSGGSTTAMKVAEAKELVEMGVDEIDMVGNIGWIRSGRDEAVVDEIRAVKQAIGGMSLKVIIECHWLTDDQIRRATELCIRAGADWVKTGTGWPETGATLENCRLIKSVAGDDIKIKAAGGVRDLKTVVEMIRIGVTRFGVGMSSGTKIMEELAAMPGGKTVVQ